MNATVTTSERPGQLEGSERGPLAVTLLLGAGAVGPLLFMIVVLVEGATRSGYSAWRHPVSALALGPQGWIQVANFLVCGALVLAFAFGLQRALHPGRGATWGPILLGVCGLGFIGAAIFKTDPAFGYPPGAPTGSTLHGTLHLLMSNVAIISVVAACIVLARRFGQSPGWRGWAVYSVATAVGVIVLSFVAILVTTSDPGSLFGLFQRLALFAALLWIALVALRLLSREVPTPR